MAGFNLGNYAGQLQLNDHEQQAALQNVQQYQPQQAGNAEVAQAAQGASGWDKTQKYMGVANSLSQDDGKQKNGLGKVLGLVGLFA